MKKMNNLVFNLKLPFNYHIQIEGKDILRTIKQKKIEELENGVILNLEHPFENNEIR